MSLWVCSWYLVKSLSFWILITSFAAVIISSIEHPFLNKIFPRRRLLILRGPHSREQGGRCVSKTHKGRIVLIWGAHSMDSGTPFDTDGLSPTAYANSRISIERNWTERFCCMLDGYLESRSKVCVRIGIASESKGLANQQNLIGPSRSDEGLCVLMRAFTFFYYRSKDLGWFVRTRFVYAPNYSSSSAAARMVCLPPLMR